MQQDLTQGSIRAGLIRFSLPLIAGNLLQQLYNVADTLIVGRFLGNVALAAVGSAFSLMILLTSLVLGLCMGSGVVFSQLYGEGNMDKLKTAMTNAFCLIAALSLLLTVLSYAMLDAFIVLLRVPPEAVPDITSYLRVIFAGIFFTFLYNFFAAVLRSVGNSLASLLFLLLSTVVNIALDLLFVLVLRRGVAGAALATVIAQGLSAAGIALYFFFRLPELRPRRSNFRLDRPLLSRIASVSVLTSVQQSIMNFGILLVQSLVNSFGVATMAAFAAGVLTGLVTGLLHTKLGIPAILAGILTQFALYSINLRIMSMKANTPVNPDTPPVPPTPVNPDKYSLFLTLRSVPGAIWKGLLLAAVLIALLYWYFGTEQGSAIRATGANPSMSRAQGININAMKVLGLSLSNGMVALSGGLMAQYQGFADINMGRGAIVIGLAAVIIGEVLCDAFFRKGCNFSVRLSFVILGGIVYYLVMVLILWLKLDPNDLKLFTALIVALFLAVPYLQKQSKSSFSRAKKRGQKEAIGQ